MMMTNTLLLPNNNKLTPLLSTSVHIVPFGIGTPGLTLYTLIGWYGIFHPVGALLGIEVTQDFKEVSEARDRLSRT